MCPDHWLRLNSIKIAAGFGLPMAIFIITVMAFIAVAINQLSQDSAKINSINALSMRAFYAAESGANIGLVKLFPPDAGASSSCNNSLISDLAFTTAGLQGCRVSVSCSLQNAGGEALYELLSTGSCGSGIDRATRKVQVVAKP